MIEKKAYRSFIRNLSRILDDCKLSKEEISSRPRSSFFDDTGFWEETKHIHYYFDVNKIKSHKDAVLDLCRDLPKIEKAVPGLARCNLTNCIIK